MDFGRNSYSSYHDFLNSMESGLNGSVINIESSGEIGDLCDKRNSGNGSDSCTLLKESEYGDFYERFAASLLDSSGDGLDSEEIANSQCTSEDAKRRTRTRTRRSGKATRKSHLPGANAHHGSDSEVIVLGPEHTPSHSVRLSHVPQIPGIGRAVYTSDKIVQNRENSTCVKNDELQQFEEAELVDNDVYDTRHDTEPSDIEDSEDILPELFPRMSINDKTQFMTPDILSLTPSFISK